MSSRPTVTLKDVRRRLKKLGFELKRQGKSHEIWDNGEGFIVPISRSSQDVGHRLLKSICHEVGMTEEEFLAL